MKLKQDVYGRIKGCHVLNLSFSDAINGARPIERPSDKLQKTAYSVLTYTEGGTQKLFEPSPVVKEWISEILECQYRHRYYKAVLEIQALKETQGNSPVDKGALQRLSTASNVANLDLSIIGRPKTSLEQTIKTKESAILANVKRIQKLGTISKCELRELLQKNIYQHPPCYTRPLKRA